MRLTLFVSLIVVSMVVLAATARAQSTETIRIISMDADITGNTATSLGPLNACTRAEPGSSVTLDLVVDAVPASRGVIGYQVNIEYDPNLLAVTAADSEYLLAAGGSYEPFEGLGDPLPDTDGNYLIIVVDIASAPEINNIEDGPGVITRLTFKAKGAGISTVAPVFNPPDEYPSLIDIQNTTIGVDSIGAASVAVGQDCPVPIEATPVLTQLPPIDQIPGLEVAVPTPAPTPVGQTPAPTFDGGTPAPGGSGTPRPTGTGSDGNNVTGPDEGDGGTSTGTVVALAALALAGVGLAAGGGFLLLRRRNQGGSADATP